MSTKDNGDKQDADSLALPDDGTTSAPVEAPEGLKTENADASSLKEENADAPPSKAGNATDAPSLKEESADAAALKLEDTEAASLRAENTGAPSSAQNAESASLEEGVNSPLEEAKVADGTAVRMDELDEKQPLAANEEVKTSSPSPDAVVLDNVVLESRENFEGIEQKVEVKVPDNLESSVAEDQQGDATDSRKSEDKKSRDEKESKVDSSTKKDSSKAPSIGSAADVHLIALINRKSGGGKGLVAWEELSERIENCTTIDILSFAKADTSEPDGKLRALIDEHPNCRLIVGGGDGTVTWTFEILDRIERGPPVGVLPLGTANEVSGCLGWSNSDNGRRLTKFADRVRSGEITDIDIWHVEYIDDNEGDDKVELPERRPATMIAFLSFGLDAQIAHKFHLNRESRKSQPSVLGSKMVYLRYGAEEIRRPSKKLNKLIDIKVDGEGLKRKCPRSYRCLQLLNINSMADGVDFFGTAKSNKDDVLQEGEYTPPKLNDGKFEIVGSKTVHQTNLIRMNIGHSLRLAQGKTVDFTLSEPTPLEVDGEAWVNPKGVVRVTPLGGRDIVIGPKNTSSTRRGIIRKNIPKNRRTSKVSLRCM